MKEEMFIEKLVKRERKWENLEILGWVKVEKNE